MAINNLTIEKSGMEEEATEGLDVALGMEVEEDSGREGKEGVYGAPRALKSLEFLTRDVLYA